MALQPTPPRACSFRAVAAFGRRMKDHTMLQRIGLALSTTVGPPSLLLGATWSTWWAFLRDNAFRIGPMYWPRAFSTSWITLINSVIHRWERRAFESKLVDVTIEPPIFILGFYRSGTTYLHNLLSVDPRLAYPNTFQVTFPNTFLTTEPLASALINRTMFKKRPMDNMYMDVHTPQEDEFALCTMTTLSPCTGWILPRHHDRYERYLTFRDVPTDDVDRWKAAFTLFLKKLTWKYRRPLVLKSPPHTARIGMLLEMFPKARFVHIHRNPYTVFQSYKHTQRRVSSFMLLQAFDEERLDEHIFRQYSTVYSAFFEQEPRIPRAQFFEIAFEDLVKAPVAVLRGLYEHLGLVQFCQVEPLLVSYVDSQKGYQRNRFPPLCDALRERIAREWQRCFARWGYRI
jgi:hypothetical protein